MTSYEIDGVVPVIDPTAFVHDTASIIGQVVLAEETSVWPGAVLRAESEPIVIGRGSARGGGAGSGAKKCRSPGEQCGL